MTETDKKINPNTFWERSGGHPDPDQFWNPDSNPQRFWLRQPKFRRQVHLALPEVCALGVLSSS